MLDSARAIFTVPVRELVEFVLRQGDLGRERDFVGRDRALAGSRGHQKWQRSRPKGYQKEVCVSHELSAEGFVLRVQGRIDGILSSEEVVQIEEIKTVHADWKRVPDPLHWAQAKCYGFMYALEQHLERIDLQLVYIDLDSDEVTHFQERWAFTDLADFFLATSSIYLEWIREHHQWCVVRNESIRQLTLPFPGYRAGQRELAVAAYRAIVAGKRLFVEAPTGIGKTMATIFPSIKALGEGKVERIFYLTARTTGQAAAEKTFADLRQAQLHLRSLTLTAKEKVCVQSGQPCDVQTCPMAIGYYDRRRPAMRAALRLEALSRPALESIACDHQVCPFELALDLSLWVDATICDYNYVFNPTVYLRRHFAENRSDCVLLVDEAHNLVDRARDMFSAELERGPIRELRKAVRSLAPSCSKALGRLDNGMSKLSSAIDTAEVETAEPTIEFGLFPAEAMRERTSSKGIRPERQDSLADPRQCQETFPEALHALLAGAIDAVEAWLSKNEPAEFRRDLLELYFRLLSFSRTAESYDHRFVTIITPGTKGGIKLFCLDPSELLSEALERGNAAVLFSATLRPLEYYRVLLGGRTDDPLLRLGSPFPQENLAVLIQDRVRTHFKARSDSQAAVIEAIATVVGERCGNYLVYFPSYRYLQTVQEEFQLRFPNVRVLAQGPRMTDLERRAFLETFAPGPKETRVGFAVLGGIFGEAIDLAGDRLIGAIVVGVGMPQLCLERDLIRSYFQARVGSGFDYAYTFPGMNRVLQATGRVIRSEIDRGVVLLIDARFDETRYRGLLPEWWKPIRARTAADIQRILGTYWRVQD